MTSISFFSKTSFPYSIEKSIPAAVLILLFPRNNDICFFLTQRTDDVEHHKGQISLPGGVWEKGEQLHETAIRETEEEIGVDKNIIQLVGGLTPFYIPVTGFMVHPFIGWCNKEPSTNIQIEEVNKLFTVSLSTLLNDHIFQSENWEIRGQKAVVPFYNFEGRKVWGVTASILSEFKLILKDMKL
ncbi:MAG: CoA pyrophosphatase [Candidatus Marinimicrobia bacterium]|nr:CoA pyrophosphatase [Candidatus Neomarinimicrobiota bacterium]MBL7009859.1 CoA pyrophosphatase [Candidatus Neomarinimicrobiota bacterium]MBL7029902.1 CoA pyrophosphatase [Candidatus Neomarinimicrobiota bacterium]